MSIFWCVASRPWLLALSIAPALAGCATTSFRPPVVRADKAWNDDGACPPKTLRTNGDIDQDVAGALAVIENFRLAYGCMTTELADGRQAFEVPSALALAGGAAAAAFGAGPDVAIATGATSALFAQGKAYYDPRARGHVVASALDAVICIKREASGISSKVAAGDAARTARFGAALSGSVDVPPQFQYYQMVTSSLHDVHSILTDRLQAVGKFSPSALADEISALAKKQQAAESPANQQSTHAQFSSLGFTAQNGLAAVVEGSIALDALAPKLELCVVRAKSG